jgi:hypothetical protein
MEQEGSGQEKPQWLMYRHSCRPFETCPSDMLVSKMNLFSDKIRTSNPGNTHLQCQIFRILKLLDIGLKEFCCICLG